MLISGSIARVYRTCSEILAALNLPDGAESGYSQLSLPRLCTQDNTEANNIEKFIGSTGCICCTIGSWNNYELSSTRALSSNPEQE